MGRLMLGFLPGPPSAVFVTYWSTYRAKTATDLMPDGRGQTIRLH